PLPQDGNPLPRLFRLPKDQAIINRMGFNNEGVDAVVERLKKRKSDIIIGGNIGKNKLTPNENAVDDYLICFNKLFDYVDYFVVNVSSPNTPNLRALQEKDKLFAILNTLQEINATKAKSKPILLKIAPDLNSAELDDVLSVVQDSKIAGIISSNTTIDRSALLSSKEEVEKIGNGGLSGKAVLEKSNQVLDYLNKNNPSNIPIIAVGGITKAQDALEKISLGAQLVQVYTGFIYEGPGLIKRINKAILNS
ncbi:MAG: quinone-dependent dihydroorotate dehydrogenase, partial [Bacteroidetes bacterium]|nr:quinone-dependent dihydroorotate dehydrogenase [Bacteroidota bacterium]